MPTAPDAVGSQWEITTEGSSIKVVWEDALESANERIHGCYETSTIEITLDEPNDAAEVTKPEGVDLRFSEKETAEECATVLCAFVERNLDGEWDYQAGGFTDEEVLEELSIYRDLPDGLQTQAESLFQQYEESRDKKIANRNSSIATALYIVERMNGRSVRYSDFDLYETFFYRLTGIQIQVKGIHRDVRRYQRELPINVASLNDPVSEVERVAETLEFSPEVENLAVTLADNHIDYDPEASSYKRATIAGSAIYNALRYYSDDETHGVSPSQNEIADAVGCSGTTIGQNYERQWDVLTEALDSVPP
jgi:hypothetical protein